MLLNVQLFTYCNIHEETHDFQGIVSPDLKNSEDTGCGFGIIGRCHGATGAVVPARFKSTMMMLTPKSQSRYSTGQSLVCTVFGHFVVNVKMPSYQYMDSNYKDKTD